MSTDGFPGAIWIPAHTDRYARRDSRVIEEIVLHITEGGTDKAEITAHNAFGIARYLQNGKWMQQAAHYIVGRDGTVVQCVRHKDIAFHAGPANDWTIGIEHNTRSAARTRSSPPRQYLKSAELVLWLCNMLGFAADRHTYPGTRKPIPRATHSSCPRSRARTGTLIWRPSPPPGNRARKRLPMRIVELTMRSRLLTAPPPALHNLTRQAGTPAADAAYHRYSPRIAVRSNDVVPPPPASRRPRRPDCRSHAGDACFGGRRQRFRRRPA